MSITTVLWQTSAAAFAEIACRDGPLKRGFIFLPEKSQPGEPLGIVIGADRVTILAQGRNLSGRIQYWKLYLRTRTFWDIYNGRFEITGSPMYTKVAEYPTAAQRITAFTFLPVRIFDPPLPPDDFLSGDGLLRIIGLIITDFSH